MLSVETVDYDTHRIIIYRNQNDVAIRQVILDLKGNIIQDEISEFDEQGQLICENVFINHTTLIAYREYYDDGHNYGYRDYKWLDGQFKLLLMTQNEWLIKHRKAKCTWYDGDGQLVYYDIFEYDEQIGEMVWQFCYDENHNMIEPQYLEQYSDYYLQFV
ncbi:hypothetical protein [Moraxella sp. ZY210820]|uniref:hypothetical protein n=1 Tax=unclassified Moraxella TaxID=2685852 RepID=UPI002730A331|nr:hypothetical protein [Moraxella sp. ZY210820]WLF84242.1 hypothetical protein LU301_01735 [Moraxella sp. ZY210820]